jgi:hypothetical protein
MWTAATWKRFYASERARLGARGLEALLERAPEVVLPADGAIVFPHTRLEASGWLAAAAAGAVVASGADRVLAIGVLHRARERDAELVARAVQGDVAAREPLRRLHAPGAPGDPGHADEEFSLDGFAALLDAAARRAGRSAPRIIARYPFLAGTEPASLLGFDELVALRDAGVALVATADPVHHGAGYGTPEPDRLAREAPSTRETARRWMADAFTPLGRGDYCKFLEVSERMRSDFRDAGATLAALVGRSDVNVVDFELVDYAAVLDAPEPTWVAGALATWRRESASA